MSIKEQSVLSRNTKSEIYDFVIDTSRVQIIEQVGFKTYAFSVNREQPISGVMENYIYKQNDDGTYQQYLLGYFCTFDTEGNIQYTSNDLQITPIDDPSLLSRDSCYPEFVQVSSIIVCTMAFRCYGPTADGNHEVGDNCECPNTPDTCYQPGMSCTEQPIFGWTNCPGGLPDDDLPGPIDPPGSGGNTYTAPDGTVYTILVPTLLFQGILNCLNGLGEIGQTDNTTINPAILASLNLTMAQTTPMINYLNSSGCSEQAQADVLEDIYAVIIAKITECLGSELEASINSLSYENLGTIHSYLIVGNGCSEEAKVNIIETLLNPYISIDDDLISTNLLTNDCAENIIRNEIIGDADSEGTNAGLINSIRNIFYNDNNVTLVFRNSANVTNITNATTDFDDQVDIDNGVYDISITLSNYYLAKNPTKLSLAMTLIHEMVHAKLMYSYLHGTLLSEYPTYTDLNDKFDIFLANRTYVNGEALNDSMHIAMVDFISTMSHSLFKYAQRTGMTNVTEQYCKDITKGSYYGTPAMELIDTGSNTPEELNNLNVNEQDNEANAQGDDC